MSSAILTVIGLYNYDHSLFDNMVLPDGIDKGLVIDAIIMQGGDYEVIYPNPELFKELIGSWSRQWYDTFYNWYRALEAMKEIRPLDNYDRYEQWSDDAVNHSVSSDSIKGSGSTIGQDSSHGSASVDNDTTDTSKISAYDSNDFVNQNQTISNNTQSNTTDTSANTSTQSTSNTDTNAESTGTNNNKHEGHIYGNIGVTTSATVFKEFYDTLLKYGNISKTIADVFLNNFVIPIM